MKNKNIAAKTICCNKDVTFVLDDTVYAGTIQNIGNYGASVSTNNQLKVSEGKKIRMTILFDSQEDVKNAEVVWSDETGFGAKFIYPAE